MKGGPMGEVAQMILWACELGITSSNFKSHWLWSYRIPQHHNLLLCSMYVQVEKMRKHASFSIMEVKALCGVCIYMSR